MPARPFYQIIPKRKAAGSPHAVRRYAGTPVRRYANPCRRNFRIAPGEGRRAVTMKLPMPYSPGSGVWTLLNSLIHQAEFRTFSHVEAARIEHGVEGHMPVSAVFAVIGFDDGGLRIGPAEDDVKLSALRGRDQDRSCRSRAHRQI